MTTGSKGKNIYVLDTSAILECRARYYPPDIFPGLYENFEAMIASEELIAPEEVYRELEKKDDEAFAWAKHNRRMFIPLDEKNQVEVNAILISHPRLIEAGGRRSAGDPFVIALAKVVNGVVVTMEKNIATEKKVRIPKVCTDLGVRWMTVLEFIRERKWVFRK